MDAETRKMLARERKKRGLPPYEKFVPMWTRPKQLGEEEPKSPRDRRRRCTGCGNAMLSTIPEPEPAFCRPCRKEGVHTAYEREHDAPAKLETSMLSKVKAIMVELVGRDPMTTNGEIADEIRRRLGVTRSEGGIAYHRRNMGLPSAPGRRGQRTNQKTKAA